MNKIILVFVVVLSCVLSRATEEDYGDVREDFSNMQILLEATFDNNYKSDLYRLNRINAALFSRQSNSSDQHNLISPTDEQKNKIVQKAIKSLTKIIKRFHRKFDKNVKFPLLYDAIEEIDAHANQYLGSPGKSLRSLRFFSVSLRKMFQGTVVPVFEWCSKEISDDLYGVSETALIIGEEKALNSIYFSKLLMNTSLLLQKVLIEALHKVQGRRLHESKKGLDRKLRIASQMVNGKNLGLDDDETNLDSFIRLFKSDDKVKELIKLPSNLQIIHELERACHGYVNWFKSDLKEYARNNELCDEEIRNEFTTIENDFLNLTNNMGEYYNGLDSVRDDRLEKINKEANNYFINKTETSRKVLELVLQNQSIYATVRNGIDSLTNFIEKFHSEFDNKVKFPSLSYAIDQIDKYASNYQGAARNKLLNLRHFNPIMRKVFIKCVTPVFEWCSNGYLDDIEHVLRKHLTAGEEKALLSINYLKVLLFQRNYVQRALYDTLRAVQEDYGPNGFYGKQGIQLTYGLEENLRSAIEVAYQEDLGLDEDERNILAFLGFQPKDNIGTWINGAVLVSSLQKLASACSYYNK